MELRHLLTEIRGAKVGIYILSIYLNKNEQRAFQTRLKIFFVGLFKIFTKRVWGLTFLTLVSESSSLGLKKNRHITIRGCYIKKTEIKCDCLYKLFSTHMSS
jgi:hypothetical protein